MVWRNLPQTVIQIIGSWPRIRGSDYDFGRFFEGLLFFEWRIAWSRFNQRHHGVGKSSATGEKRG
jgi:hypothetical protein